MCAKIPFKRKLVCCKIYEHKIDNTNKTLSEIVYILSISQGFISRDSECNHFK